MKRILLVAAATILLAGCPSMYVPDTQPPIEPVEPTMPVEPVAPPAGDKVPPLPPKPKTVDWTSAVSPLINQMIASSNVEKSKVLLVDSVKNNTNGSFSVANVTSTITKTVDATGQFEMVPQDVISSARKALGLPIEDSLVSRSKAIGLGRLVRADYVLYSVIEGSNSKRDIEMQLLSVQTGEILWTGQGEIE